MAGRRVVAVAAGGMHSLAITADGALWRVRVVSRGARLDAVVSATGARGAYRRGLAMARAALTATARPASSGTYSPLAAHEWLKTAAAGAMANARASARASRSSPSLCSSSRR